MNAIRNFLSSIRTDFRRWKNHRARARRVIYTWPQVDQRNWSDEYMRSLR